MRYLLTALIFPVSVACAPIGDAEDTSDSEQGQGAAVDEHDSASLREATHIEGRLAAGSAITVQYARDSEYKRVPYLAVDIVGEAQKANASTRQISVAGGFPGTPRVLVVDEMFHVLVSADATTRGADGISSTTLVAPLSARHVIVRDSRWSKPMSFQVRIGN